MTTAHINAKKNSFAESILLPGDPLRAKHIANVFLKNATEVTNVRGMLGFTGLYKGEKVSVMGTGMGIPSISIYAFELINFYGVKNLIRTGSAGTYKYSNLKVQDVVLAIGACTDSNTNRTRFNGFDFAATPSFSLLNLAYEQAKNSKQTVNIGNCFTSDCFYHPQAKLIKEAMQNLNVLCVEMETSALYTLAHQHKVNALSVLTISDIIDSDKAEVENLTSSEREQSMNNMITLALDTLIKA